MICSSRKVVAKFDQIWCLENRCAILTDRERNDADTTGSSKFEIFVRRTDGCHGASFSVSGGKAEERKQKGLRLK